MCVCVKGAVREGVDFRKILSGGVWGVVVIESYERIFFSVFQEFL